MSKQNVKSALERVNEKKQSDALAEIPDYLRPQDGEQRLGNENVGRADVVLPRLAICQSNSYEKKKSHAKYIEGLEEGQYFNTATGEIYGNSVRVINVHYFRSRIRWKGEIGEGLFCISQDALTGAGDPGGECAKCKYAQFGSAEDEKRPGCTLFMNFPCLVIDAHNKVDLANIITASFKSIATGAARRWNTLVNIRNAHRFGGVYKLTTVEDHRTSGDSWQPHVENDGWATREQAEAGRLAYQLIESWQSQGRLSVEQEAGEVEV